MNVHFSIHGDWLTDHIRNLLEEGSITKSWNTFATLSEDENIFRDIIKGRKAFEGINDLELISTSKEDLTQGVLARLSEDLIQSKKDLNEASTYFNSPLKYFNEEEGMTLGELVDMKKHSLDDAKNVVNKLQTELDLMVKLFSFTKEDIVLSCLIKLSSKDLSSDSGWITDKGWFLPVPCAGHDALIYGFNEKMETNFSIHEIEKRWVRISTSVRTVVISAWNFTLKPKQALTLEKWILKHEAIEDGKSLSIHGYGMAYRDGNQIKFDKRSDD